MSEKEIGKVEIFYATKLLIWEIPTFFPLSLSKYSRILSPEIVIVHKKIHWNFMPFQMRKIVVPKGSIGLIFSSANSIIPIRKCIRLGIVDESNTVVNCCEAEWIEKHGVFENGYFIVPEIMKSSEFVKRIHLFCEIINKENGQIAKISTSENYIHETDAAAKVIANEGNADNDSEKCSCPPDEDKNQKLKNLTKLSENLQELYIGGKHTDVIIKVKDREFKVHKAILTARSPVFDAMFTHGLSECNTGVVPIEDCEPAVFEEFLFFLYTGRIQQLSSENVCELYFIADKYQISELKEECVSFLKKSMTIETICDIICLSTKCNETELLNLAINFFARNMEEILVTLKWQLFLKENPTEANELSIKALKLGFVKRKF